MAREWFDTWNLISMRRTQHQGWSPSSPVLKTTNPHPSLPFFRAVVGRNRSLCRRYLRARRQDLRAGGNTTCRNAAMWETAGTLPDPSDDEVIPVAPGDLPSTLPRPSNLFQGAIAPRATTRRATHMPLVRPQKRQGDPMEASPKKEHRETEDLDESAEDLNLADPGIPLWDDKHYRLHVNREDRERASHYPALGWPIIEKLLGDDAGAHLTHREFDTKPLCYVAPDTMCERPAEVDPVSLALYEAGARRVDPKEFRLLTVSGLGEYPLATSHFSSPELPDRRFRKNENVNCQWGIQLGPNASGECTNHLQNPKCMPPALRRSFPREVLEFLRARGQFGFPASLHTDSCLEFRAMEHQSREVASYRCDTHRRISIQIVEPVGNGHDASAKAPTQKAKVGSRSCSLKATHFAVPRSFEVGEYSQMKERGADLWASDAQRAGRRLAPVTYVLNSNGTPPPAGWDWAARYLEFFAPGPFIRSIYGGAPVSIRTIADAEYRR